MPSSRLYDEFNFRHMRMSVHYSTERRDTSHHWKRRTVACLTAAPWPPHRHTRLTPLLRGIRYSHMGPSQKKRKKKKGGKVETHLTNDVRGCIDDHCLDASGRKRGQSLDSCIEPNLSDRIVRCCHEYNHINGGRLALASPLSALGSSILRGGIGTVRVASITVLLGSGRRCCEQQATQQPGHGYRVDR
jgi:hypothetical protein